MNYYPFHIGDFRSGTSNMGRLQRAIYRELLDICYDTEKPLPLDRDELYDAIGAESEEEQRIVERLLRFKFVQMDDGYHHTICEKVISEYHAKAEVAKANGRLGGRPVGSKNNPKEPSGLSVGTQGKPDQNPAETGSQPNQEPITNNQEPKQKSKAKPPAATFDPLSDLAAEGVAPQTAADWLAMRKAKRAPVTTTVLQTIVSEVSKAGMSMDTALALACSRGWTGFQADWVLKDQRAGPAPPGMEHLGKAGQATARNAEAWMAKKLKEQQNA